MTAPSQSTSTGRGQENDDLRTDVAFLSSPLSTPLTTSPEPVSFQSLVDQTTTPLSMMDDSWFLDADNKTNVSGLGTMDFGAVGAGGDKPTAFIPSSNQLPAGSSARDMDPSAAQGQHSADPTGTGTVSAVGDGHAEETRTVDDIVVAGSSATDSGSSRRSGQDDDTNWAAMGQDGETSTRHQLRKKRQSQQTLISPTAIDIDTTNPTAQNSSAPFSGTSLRGLPQDQHQHQRSKDNQIQRLYETAPAPTGTGSVPALPASGIVPAGGHCNGTRNATQNMANNASASTPPSAASTGNKSVSPGHRPGYRQGHRNDHSSHDTSSPSYNSSSSPLGVGNVQSNTDFVQPRPRTFVRTAPDSESPDIKHPTPDITSQARSGAYVGNIAQLEATAERLSMTSSIDDAIRDLHSAIKRSDSRRSSILAASLKASGSIDDYTAPGYAVDQIRRHPSIASSIVSTNNAARHGGYSPGGFVLSPSHSLTGRLRSGSKNSAGRPDFDLDTVLSRHGPGKASVRSARSAKTSLAEISESEPIALTQDVLDMADKSHPLKNAESDSLLPEELRDANVPATDVFHGMMGDDDFLDRKPGQSPPNAKTGILAEQESRDPKRPGSSRSDTTFQQCQDAFGDFDGVHWVPEQVDPYALPDGLEPQAPKRRVPPPAMARPQSYMDPESGQQMLFYPARVPAMLNLPPKLSNKPKAADRNKRRSQVMSAMFEGQRQPRVLDGNAPGHDSTRDSWLPDPLAGQRNSFAALSSEQLSGAAQEPQTVRSIHSDRDETHVAQPEISPDAEAEPPLRRPQRLSRDDLDKRKSRMSDLPPQLRASAYFDMPSTTQPDIEVKDGSAMATLESILDASANAPVSAFTDHDRAGKLGGEVYGMERKRASVAASTVLQPESGGTKHAKKRSSFMWLGKRQSHASDDNQHRASQSESGLGPINADTNATENQALARSVDGNSEGRIDDDEQLEAKEEAEDMSDDDGYYGPPTTLLAELQLRKQQQKQRTQLTFPGGMHATLLEMDAVAQTQQKRRKDRRVNLAWEDGERQPANEDSDDEDVPLAIIAARNQGAQNVMDLNRPLGLMERREMEDNEPLSHRRARLHGQDPRSIMLTNRPSMNNLSANNLSASHLPHSPHSPHSAQNPTPEPDEFEGETLADRKRRLAAQDEAENLLPKARPVSGAFSVELLNQFGDQDKKKDEAEKPKAAAEDETLGQRRRRLQAEREAREREMSFNQLNAEPGGLAPGIKGRMHQMSDVLSAHPKREGNVLAREERARMERNAKMPSYRSMMPQNAGGAGNAHAGGFRGGTFNDGTGGQGPQAAMSSPALNTQLLHQPALNHRASAVFSPYGAPMMQGPYGGSAANLGAMNNMGGYGGMNTANPYGGGAMSVYGAPSMMQPNMMQPNMMQPNMMQPNTMQPNMQMPVNGGSVNRIEQWRQGILP
ncbi:hypothetical protein FZEAL_6080 [Fusarium zealandicum]|uniref:Uncharacterized protein n=1 Tax=Fusarium zealandicum TaxID=1053134 RepID=A0A8H4UJD9_9HYPO|nr:hypothetical protein FZEAL_6080 [Fusarium zealandicum]